MRPVPKAGVGALAIAVYAEPSPITGGLPDRPRVAQESGVEGVACVDDTARAVVLYCRRGQPADRALALGLLRYTAYMQDPDGRFVNFTLDWEGSQNRAGSTSYPGGPQWQARAAHALACAVATFGPAEWDERYLKAVRWLDDAPPYQDVRAVGVLATVEHWRATHSDLSARRTLAWAEEIASHRQAGRLLNAPGVDSIHLWGHLQEAALAEAGTALARPDLVAVARESADALLIPAAAQLDTMQNVLPFDVSCVVSGLAAVARATGDAGYAAWADRARAWFHGRNAAREPVYDPRLGLVYDGIDQGRVSRNSGAESNIEGALALLA